MRNLVRFGRKIPVPSTIEIKHDLRMMAGADAILAASAAPDTAEACKQLALVVGDLAAKHGLSRDRAAMLVARFGLDQMEGSARDLRTSKG